ncbi:MAG: hypothetical protein JXL97_06425 [Bacteroidales bacterium]|nr:hypothetical protein [Bacteroidales bacterium]
MNKLFSILFISIFFVFVSCKNDNTENQSDTTLIEVKDTTSVNPNEVTLGKEYTSKYICPNHCKGSGSEEAGVCPVCGMDYIENFDYQQ